MHKQKIALIVAAAIGMLSIFLPWANVPLLGSISGTSSNIGWIMFVLFGITLAVILFLGDRKKAVDQKDLKQIAGIIAPAAIAALIAIWQMISFNSSMKGLGADNPYAALLSSSVSLGIGLYIAIIAGIAVVAIIYLMKDKEKKKTTK